MLFNAVHVHDNDTYASKTPKLMETPGIGIGCLAHINTFCCCNINEART